MLAYQIAKLLSVTFCLPCTDSRYVLQFLYADRIHRRHRLQRRILENDIGRHIQVLGHLFTQVQQRIEQRRIRHACTSSGTAYHLFVVIFKLIVFRNHERFRLLHELTPLCRQLQDAVILNLFLQITGYQCLPDDSIPKLFLMFVTASETIQISMLMSDNLVCLLTN